MKFVETKEEMREHDVFKKASAICKENGYELTHILLAVYDDFTMPSIQMRPTNGFSPDVYFMEHYGKEPEFAIQTTSYGALNMEDYAKFMEACSKALRMVQDLSNIPTDTWPSVDRRK